MDTQFGTISTTPEQSTQTVPGQGTRQNNQWIAWKKQRNQQCIKN